MEVPRIHTSTRPGIIMDDQLSNEDQLRLNAQVCEKISDHLNASEYEFYILQRELPGSLAKAVSFAKEALAYAGWPSIDVSIDEHQGSNKASALFLIPFVHCIFHMRGADACPEVFTADLPRVLLDGLEAGFHEDVQEYIAGIRPEAPGIRIDALHRLRNGDFVVYASCQ
jgi:hypothetical protein